MGVRGVMQLGVLLLGTVALALGAACSGESDAAPPPAVPPAAGAATQPPPTVVLRVATEGAPAPYLVGPDGRTVYLFTEDHPGLSHCDGACLAAWPPLLVEGGTPAGEGVSGEIGHLERAEGRQVTLNGMPLYYWSGDRAPGDTSGQGVNGVWFVVSPAGEAITDAAAPAASGTSGDYAPDGYDY